MLTRLTLICAILGGTVVRADDSFTKGLSPADFQAAGLGRLTPEELAVLDALVRAQQSGAVAKAKEDTAKVVTDAVRAETTKAVTAAVKEETTKAVTEEVRQQVQAEDRKAAQKQASTAGFIDRMKVVLKPGTEIEYTTLDAELIGRYHGWEKGTIFTLTNGQRWLVVDDDRYWAPGSDKPVHVHIVPGILGSFFMEIEKGGRPRVKFLGNASATPAPR